MNDKSTLSFMFSRLQCPFSPRDPTLIYDIDLFKLRSEMWKKAMNLIEKHEKDWIFISLMVEHLTSDPKIIWKALKARFRPTSYELTAESDMRKSIASWKPEKHQTLQDFERMINIAYCIIKDIRGNEVSKEEQEKNFRLIMNQRPKFRERGRSRRFQKKVIKGAPEQLAFIE
eukprot:gene858-911_t